MIGYDKRMIGCDNSEAPLSRALDSCNREVAVVDLHSCHDIAFKSSLESRMAIKLLIDRSRCVGHARCAAVAPDLVVLDSEGYIAVNQIDVPDGQQNIAKRAARACPERAISVEQYGEYRSVSLER
jgi:ferredoxin